MTLNKKGKLSTNQNLMPNKLLYQYLYQRTIVPALILVVSIILLSGAVYVVTTSATTWFNEKAAELVLQDLSQSNKQDYDLLQDKKQERDDLQKEYDNFYINNPFNVKVDDSILKTLAEQIAIIKAELKELENRPTEGPVVETSDRYHIDELLLYIDKIRTQNVVIISLEDENSSQASGSNHLVYLDDVGNAAFSLHGMATSATELSRFMTSLNQCEYVSYTKIISVETQTLSDGRSLYVFEIAITPKLN